MSEERYVRAIMNERWTAANFSFSEEVFFGQKREKVLLVKRGISLT